MLLRSWREGAQEGMSEEDHQLGTCRTVMAGLVVPCTAQLLAAFPIHCFLKTCSTLPFKKCR